MNTQSHFVLAWGAKVSEAFARRVIQTRDDFSLPDQFPNWLMACMKFESGLNPKAKNPHSTATGLIQFMEAVAKFYGTTTAALAAMTAEQQFDYVWLYFRDAIKAHGPIKNLGDCYMAILNPVAIGKPDDYAMWVSGSSQYVVNSGLDTNHDHRITRGEAAARVGQLLIEGSGPTNTADIVLGTVPVIQPKGNWFMDLISSAFKFVFDHTFAAAARAAATANPVDAAGGIAAVQVTPMPADGSPNSTAGQASGPIKALEDDLNNLVANFVKTTVDQLPAVGGVAEVTGLDQKAADAAKALLVLGEQHALTYLSALFSAHHKAVDSVTSPNNGAPK